MNWLFFALLAPAIYASVVYVDKFLLEKEIDDYRGIPIFTGILGLIMGTLFWFVGGMPILSIFNTTLVLLAGMLTLWSLVIYLKAVSIEDASNVNIFFQLFPIITLSLSFLFLKESISFTQFIGFIVILSSTIGVTLKTTKMGFRLPQSFYLILAYDCMWAVSGIIMKFALEANSFIKILNYESWGIALGALILYLFFPTLREAFHHILHTSRKRAFIYIVLNEIIFIIAKTCTFFAFSLGPVALVSVLEGTQVFYAIVYGWVLTVFASKIYKEDITREGLLKKIGLGILLFIGILIVNN